MKPHILHRKQSFPVSIEKAWDFFSNPGNLAVITPPWLGFEITSDIPEEICIGMVITYEITPFFGIPVSWVTEITHIKKPNVFVDEQRFGPYKFWHHQHLFRNIEGGVEVEDIVHYLLPFGYLGRIVHGLIVSKKLEEIFDFRSRVLEEEFGKVE